MISFSFGSWGWRRLIQTPAVYYLVRIVMVTKVRAAALFFKPRQWIDPLRYIYILPFS